MNLGEQLRKLPIGTPLQVLYENEEKFYRAVGFYGGINASGNASLQNHESIDFDNFPANLAILVIPEQQIRTFGELERTLEDDVESLKALPDSTPVCIEYQDRQTSRVIVGFIQETDSNFVVHLRNFSNKIRENRPRGYADMVVQDTQITKYWICNKD